MASQVATDAFKQTFAVPGSPTGKPELTTWRYQTIPHPSVVKVLNEMHPPSPAYLVSDIEQPREGLLKMKTQSSYTYVPAMEVAPSEPARKVCLQLQSNPLFSRRCKTGKATG